MKKQSKAEKLIKNLDNLLTKSYTEYLVLHDELKPLGNRQLNEEEFKRAQEILQEIETKYIENINPITHYITSRFQFSSNVITGYYDFVKTLKDGDTKKIIH